MSLSYPTVSTALNNYYENMKNKVVSDLNEGQASYPPDPSPENEWISNFASVYDIDALSGVPTETSVLIVSDVSTLSFDLIDCSSMASSISAYWENQLTFGTPKYDSVISITNDASKINSTISSYVCGLVSTEKNPPYEHLFLFVENEVKSIIWTVTEQNGDNTETYTVTIS